MAPPIAHMPGAEQRHVDDRAPHRCARGAGARRRCHRRWSSRRSNRRSPGAGCATMPSQVGGRDAPSSNRPAPRSRASRSRRRRPRARERRIRCRARRRSFGLCALMSSTSMCRRSRTPGILFVRNTSDVAASRYRMSRPGRTREVESETLLAPVRVLDAARAPARRGRRGRCSASRASASPRSDVLDLDHFRTPVGEDRRRRRHEGVLGDLEDADALHHIAHAPSCRAKRVVALSTPRTGGVLSDRHTTTCDSVGRPSA